MSEPASARGRATFMLVVAGLAGLTACHRAPLSAVAAPPSLPATEQISAPVHLSQSAPVAAPTDTAAEQHVDIDTHGDEDVRLLLAYLANVGHFSLVYPPDLDKKVRLQLHDVPLSQAVQVVLAAAGLTLEPMNGTTPAVRSSSVVFYQVPVNIDSLSVDAIMKRFGVGRTTAEMIVEENTHKP